MEIKFQAPEDYDGSKRFSYRVHDMFRDTILLIFKYHGIFINPEDLEVSYNGHHKIVEVSIYRYSCAEYGHGTLESRNRNWNETKEKIALLFPEIETSSGWAWSNYPRYKGQKQDFHEIPSVRFFIPKGYVVKV